MKPFSDTAARPTGSLATRHPITPVAAHVAMHVNERNDPDRRSVTDRGGEERWTICGPPAEDVDGLTPRPTLEYKGGVAAGRGGLKNLLLLRRRWVLIIRDYWGRPARGQKSCPPNDFAS